MSKVFFIGAGPGDPELITVRGAKLLREADLVVYAGSLVPQALLAEVKPGARVVDSAPLTLEQTHALLSNAARRGELVARVHTGDPGLYGAVREQAALLDAEGIDWEVVPGVTAAFAAAARARVSFTVPNGTQTLILCRRKGRTPVPEAEALSKLARHGAALAIYLSAQDATAVQAELLAGGYAPETRAVVAHAVGWPDEALRETNLAGLTATTQDLRATRQTVFLVLPGQDAPTRSKLYDGGFAHGWRAETKKNGADPKITKG